MSLKLIAPKRKAMRTKRPETTSLPLRTKLKLLPRERKTSQKPKRTQSRSVIIYVQVKLNEFINGVCLVLIFLNVPFVSLGSNEAGPSSAKDTKDVSAIEAEEEEDPSNLQLAWEMFELAKAIFTKHIESLDAESPIK